MTNAYIGPNTKMQRRYVTEPTVEDYLELVDETERVKSGGVHGITQPSAVHLCEFWHGMTPEEQKSAWDSGIDRLQFVAQNVGRFA